MTSPVFGVYPESKLSMDMAHSRIHTDTSPIHVHVFIFPIAIAGNSTNIRLGLKSFQQVSHSDGDGTSEKNETTKQIPRFYTRYTPLCDINLKLICLLGQYRFWKTTSNSILLISNRI
jgi:hypothetical protein